MPHRPSCPTRLIRKLACALALAAPGCMGDGEGTGPEDAAAAAAAAAAGAAAGGAGAAATDERVLGGGAGASPAQAPVPVETLAAATYQGYGASTKGGSAGTTVQVTSLADSGPGTLREALSASNRRVVFAVSGTIALASALRVENRSALTLDGLSAPAPGVTLTGNPLYISNSHDIVVSGLRVRGSAFDGISILNGSYRIVVDHCSLADSADENLGLTEGVHDVTLSWSLLGASRPEWYDLQGKGILIANFSAGPVTRVTLHHNLFVQHYQRSPQASSRGLFDIRHNVLAEWGAYGIRMRAGAYGNIVGNVLSSARNGKKALLLNTGLEDASGSVYVSGNVGPTGADINALTMRASRYSTPTVTATATGDLGAVLAASAGVLPRDPADQALLAAVPTP